MLLLALLLKMQAVTLRLGEKRLKFLDSLAQDICVALGSTGNLSSAKTTLAYLLSLIELLRHVEAVLSLCGKRVLEILLL